MSDRPASRPRRRKDFPFAAEVELERRGWYELVDLVRSLTPQECLVPGYYRHPDWTVRDVVAHLGTWLAEAEEQFERISAGTYEGHVIDVDALNAAFLEAMTGQPWDVAWVQANAGRSRMLQEWSALPEQSDEAAWWIRKSGGDHYAEHLGRLRAWVAELIDRRSQIAESESQGPEGTIRDRAGRASASRIRASRTGTRISYLQGACKAMRPGDAGIA